MKYYKSFEAYTNNGSENWNIKNSLLGKVISSTFSGISTFNKKIKLNLLSVQLDNYLTAVYNKYLDIKYTEDKTDEINYDDMSYVDPELYKTSINFTTRKNNKDINISKEKEHEVEQIIPKGLDDDLKKEIEEKSDDINISKEKEVNNPELEITNTSSIKKSNDTNSLSKEEIKETEYEIKQQKEFIKEIRTRLNKLEKDNDVDHDKKKYGGTDKAKEEAEERLKIREKEIIRVSDDLEEYKNDLIELENKLKSNISEKINWAATDIFNEDWTHDDIENITSIVNPYQIEEIFIKSKNIINSSEKNKDKLSSFWELNINDVYKKWFYIFDTTKLQNKTAPINTKSDPKKKDNKDNKTQNKEKIIKKTQTLEEIFRDDIETYISPKFYGIDKDDNNWFILTIETDKIFLVKKEFINNKKMLFKLIAEVTPAEDGDVKLVKDYREINSVDVGNKNIFLYKEGNNYPHILLYENFLYSIDNWDSVNIGDYILASMTDDLFKKVLYNNKNFYKNDSVISDKKLNEVKNKKI